MEGTLLITVSTVALCGICGIYVVWKRKRIGQEPNDTNKQTDEYDEREKRVRIEMWKRGQDEWGSEEKKLFQFVKSILTFSKSDDTITDEQRQAMEATIPVLMNMQEHGSCTSKKQLASLSQETINELSNGCEQTFTGLLLIQRFCRASEIDLIKGPSVLTDS